MGRGRSRGSMRRNYRNQGSRQKNNHGQTSGHPKGKRSLDSDRQDSRNQTAESKRLKPDHVEKNNAIDQAVTSSSESEDEVKPYTQLLSMFKSSSKAHQILTSDEEEEDDNQSVGETSLNGESDDQDDGESDDSTITSDDDPPTFDELHDNYSHKQDFNEEDQESLNEEDNENELIDETEEQIISSSDQFCLHFEREINENLLNVLTSSKPYETKELKWKHLGRMVVSLPREIPNISEAPKPLLGETVQSYVSPGVMPTLRTGVMLKDYGVKLQLCGNLDKRPLSGETSCDLAEDLLTPLQHELFTLANEYRDIYYPGLTHLNNDEIRTVYCLHALNHVLKSRDKVLHHNLKLKKAKEDGGKMEEVEYRDQGLVRPRVLIVAPFRNSVVKIVEKLASILLPAKGQIINKQRFYEEFGEGKDESEKQEPKKSYKPEDFEAIFSGNIDDSFRIGISVAKRTLKLYAGFYVADILIVSPLGAFTLLLEDFDFLCSIEVLIVDQTDIFLMQNWEHVINLFKHLHLQPREQHDTDLGRVRLWALNGHSSHYRQNLIFSSVALPEIASLLRRGTNFAGKVQIENLVPTSATTVCRVVVQLPQAFHRFATKSFREADNDRFEFFVKKILPQYRDVSMSNTLIVIPSYLDFPRLRNYLRKHDYNFGLASEYTPQGKLAQVRNRFFLGKKRLLLYTERAHFFHRYTIKGIRHIIFYQLPVYPHFYPELCNLLQDAFQNKKFRGDGSQTCTVVYSTYDAPRLTAIVGSERTAELLSSDRSVHLFVSGGS